MRVRFVSHPDGESPYIEEQDLILLQEMRHILPVSLTRDATLIVKPIGDNYIEVRVED